MFRYLPPPAGVVTGLVVFVAPVVTLVLPVMTRVLPVVTLVLPVVTDVSGVVATVATVGQGKNRNMIISMKCTKHEID